MRFKIVGDALCTCFYSLKIHFRYLMNWVNFILTPIVYIAMISWFLKVMGSDSFAQKTGGSQNAMLYSAIGYAVFSIVENAWESSMNVEREMVMGTIKSNLLLPIKPSAYLYGLTLSMMSTASVVSLLILVGCVIAAMPSGGMLLQTLLFMVLSGAYFFGVALTMSAIALRVKGLSGIAYFFTFLLKIITGFVLPIRALPTALQVVSYCAPTTWAIDSIRSSILGVTPLIPYSYELALLICAAVLSNLIGQVTLRSSCKYVRENGLMDDF